VRSGVRIGVDVGSVRIGVARSDPGGTLAVPVETVKRGKGDLDAIVALAQGYEALEILVGLPLGLSGKPGGAAEIAARFAAELALKATPIPVRLVDERLTTVQAQRGFKESGVTTRQGRSIVDQAAAAIIVQHALDSERQTGEPLGTTVRTP
jgi:putative Holliday junction resolvase